MAIVDLYTGLTVPPGQSPSTQRDGKTYGYNFTMETADELIFCVANMEGVSLKNTVIGDIILGVSNDLCTIGGNAQTPNPNTTFDDLGATPEELNLIDVTSIQQLKLTATANTEVTLTISVDAPATAGFIAIAGSGAVVMFDTISDKEREDNIPGAEVEYVKRVSIDQAGVETVVGTFNADGTPYVPAGTEEFKPSPATTFDVKAKPAVSFKMDGFGIGSLYENAIATGGDGTIFLDDDNDINSKGIGININRFLQLSSPIESVQWVTTPGGVIESLIEENASIGATGVDVAERKTKQSLFIRTHNTDQQTPVLLGSADKRFQCHVTTESGAVFIIVFNLGIAGFGAQRYIRSFASAGIKVVQTATPTEVQFNLETYQPNVQDCFLLSHFEHNANPQITASIVVLANSPCGVIVAFPPADGPWNPDMLGVCDQGGQYTQSIISLGGPGTVTDVNAIGTDLGAIGGDYDFSSSFGPFQSVFSYN